MAIRGRAGAALHKAAGKAMGEHHRKSKKKSSKKRGKKKAAKKHGKKRRKKSGKKKSAKKLTRRRRRGQKGPNRISHTDPDGLGKGAVKCPAGKTATATIAKNRRKGVYVFFGRCL